MDRVGHDLLVQTPNTLVNTEMTFFFFLLNSKYESLLNSDHWKSLNQISLRRAKRFLGKYKIGERIEGINLSSYHIG
jgi:hypothetical protein